MDFILWNTIILLIITVMLLCFKIKMLHTSIDEIRCEFALRLQEDTNIGINISSHDKKIKQLAADLNQQLTLLRKKHNRYVQGDRELKQAVTGLSHDLRTPLTAICGYMDLLEQENSSQQIKEYLRIIQNRIQTLKDLTDELFRYSIVLSTDSIGAMEPLSLNRALEESIISFYGALTHHGIVPDIHLPETPVIRHLNPQALSRILSNIISNAMKYSQGNFQIILDTNGIIYFRNRTDKLDYVSVEHLFDRFYTVETGQDSTGLGLSIAKTLTAAMNGHIEAAYSDGIFEIRLEF